ncbi:MAG TPA: long-chain fatty acid--CoA ligase, partial [Kiloniellales bacterium]|nr:long-chain fatty acid--CoA ligase [Kiloniellales bacterium]
MDYAKAPSLPAVFFAKATELGDRPFLWAKREGRWTAVSWRQAAEHVRALAQGLIALGVNPGDRLMLVSENRPEWAIADLAVMTAGAITVPAYTTNTPGDHLHILNNSGAVGAMVSTKALAGRLLPAVMQAAQCRFLVPLEPLGQQQALTARVLTWQQLEEEGKKAPAQVDQRLAAIKRDDVACFIYTSGTGGTPKGVMLSHTNILANCWGAFDLLEELGLSDEVFLCFLPLSHSYEHTAGLHFPISLGAQIYYAESVEQLGNNMAEVKPTIMTAVPRLYETLHAKLRAGLAKQSPSKQKLFAKALELGLKRLRGERLSLGEKIVDRVVDKLVRDKVRARFGGRLKALVSGGAALNPEIGNYFQALGLNLLQGYGQTESSPVVSCNRPGKIQLETVGPPVKGVAVKIAEDGEILVKGDLVMKGYWGDPEGTAKAVRDGWLYTGDIGEIDGEGRIRITDRKKDIVVLSGGDNVSPARVESLLTLEPEIEQAMVI